MGKNPTIAARRIPYPTSVSRIPETFGMKNISRLASMLGSWTAETNLRYPYHGGFEFFDVRAWLVVHLTINPMRDLGCQQADCPEDQNRLCLHRPVEQQIELELCVNTNETEVEWSDLTAFFSFGFDLVAGPTNFVGQETSGGWIGPFHVVLAQEQQDDNDSLSTKKNATERFVTRYVSTPSTKFLTPNRNASIYTFQDFANYAGIAAVQTTIQNQLHLLHNNNDNMDPYTRFWNTCENGTVTPMLPMLSFDFGLSNGVVDTMNVNLQYHMLTMPIPGSDAYSVMPMVQQAFDSHDNTNSSSSSSPPSALQITGPYCFRNDVNGSWAWALNASLSTPVSTSNDADSNKNNRLDDAFTLVHGCVSGLDCLPPIAQIWNPSVQHVVVYHKSQYSTSDLNQMVLTLLCYILAVAVLLAITCNANLRRSHRRYLQRLRILHEDEVLAAASSRGAASSSSTRPSPTTTTAPPPSQRLVSRRASPQNPFGDMDNRAASLPETTSLQEPLLPQHPADKETTDPDDTSRNEDESPGTATATGNGAVTFDPLAGGSEHELV